MLIRTFEHRDVRITLHAPMVRIALLKTTEHSLDKALSGGDYVGIADPVLENLRANFPWISANTKLCEGLDWQPLTFEEARDPDKVLQSLIQWLSVIDRTLHDLWCDEIMRMNSPVDEDTGSNLSEEVARDPNA